MRKIVSEVIKRNMEYSGRKILVVDDDAELAGMIIRFLRKEGFQTSIAPNGSKAIDTVLSARPDLVLLDLNLPDMNGIEVLKRLKEIDEDISIIIITGYGGEQIAVDLMKAGAINFLSKPFAFEVLSGAIKDAMKMHDAQDREGWNKGQSSLEKFFPFLAHEIRNPLHAIGGALIVISKKSDAKDEVLQQSIRIIEEEIHHLNNFVEECLTFVRTPGKSYFEEVEIGDIISAVTNLISHMYLESFVKIKIIRDMDTSLPRVKVNYEEMKQAFLNIFKNSLEAMPEGGELVIRACHKSDPLPGCIEVVLVDSGVGVRKEHMKHLFQPFFTTKRGGTGLGLAISRKIIEERHHGKISLESEEGKGTTIRVELPVGLPMGISGEKT
jgi:signal transduction histidine kinase